MNTKAKPAIEVRLLTGEQIWSNRIYISYTYGGLIEGIPTIDSNHKHLMDLPRRAVKKFADFPVYLIPPAFKNPELKNPELQYHYKFGTPQLMPPFEIMAEFDSNPISDGCYSSLIVCWHQYSVPPLVEDWILPSMRSIPWKDLARDWNF